MPVVTQFDPGAPCWFELGTSDQAAANRFYTGLLGWSSVDHPMGDQGVYTIFQFHGQDSGASYTLQPAMQQQGAVPAWSVYFAVENVDSAASRIAGLGGKVLQGPFDVMDSGRMSLCTDPGGANFCLWQKGTSKGVGVFGDENSVSWVELSTWDTAQALAFYSALLGWTTNPSDNMPAYIEYSVAGQPRGGLLPMDDSWKGMPSQWSIYFRVADCDATVEKVKQTGGRCLFGPFAAPGVGLIALVSDPQGARFYLIQLQQA